MDCLAELMDNHKKRLIYYKNQGFNPQNILDIGAYEGAWTLMVKDIFASANVTMIEANTDKVKTLEEIGETRIAVLGKTDGDQTLYYKCKNGIPTGNSVYKENTEYKFEPEVRFCKTLDNFVTKDYDFIKMDVQGSELDIIKGGMNTIKKAEYLLLEMQTVDYNIGAPMASDVISYLQQHNFMLCDVFDLMYESTGKLIQMDALFRNGEINESPRRNRNTTRQFAVKTS